MANAQIDDNHVPTLLGTLQSDGVTPIRVQVNPANKGVRISDGTTGVASTRTTAARDGNAKPVWMGVSSVDRKTLIPIAVDSSGRLLVKST